MVFGEKLLGGGKKNEIPTIYCSMCQNKVGLAGYEPKPGWKIEGKLCSSCYGKLLGAYQDSNENSITPSESTTEQTSTKKTCSSCNHENLQESKFCTMCGAAFEQKCPKCENIPPNGSKFCNQCGASM